MGPIAHHSFYHYIFSHRKDVYLGGLVIGLGRPKPWWASTKKKSVYE